MAVATSGGAARPGVVIDWVEALPGSETLADVFQVRNLHPDSARPVTISAHTRNPMALADSVEPPGTVAQFAPAVTATGSSTTKAA
jgi:hypothetical protein